MNCTRRIASWILLAAYLPMVVISSVHVHHETIDIHDDCLRCVGHFEAQHNHQCDCQYCHFLSLSYLGQTCGQQAVLLPATETFSLSVDEPTLLFCYGMSQFRAPPVC